MHISVTLHHCNSKGHSSSCQVLTTPHYEHLTDRFDEESQSVSGSLRHLKSERKISGVRIQYGLSQQAM